MFPDTMEGEAIGFMRLPGYASRWRQPGDELSWIEWSAWHSVGLTGPWQLPPQEIQNSWVQEAGDRQRTRSVPTTSDDKFRQSPQAVDGGGFASPQAGRAKPKAEKHGDDGGIIGMANPAVSDRI
ncbi:MAG: hypothetical protein KatS3mg107_0461 [Gemmataceae bacterium]|nr:MAG: hypothetical protein KatS3mg107_0461 [Gemmataceae bacterium]